MCAYKLYLNIPQRVILKGNGLFILWTLISLHTSPFNDILVLP